MGGNLTFNDNDDVQLKGATDSTLIGNSGNKLLVEGVAGYSAKPTYSASRPLFALAASGTDVFTITGSASKTIRIVRLVLQFTLGGKQVSFFVIKRSSANSGGTSGTATAVPHDSLSAAGTATVRSYTANPTLGTEVGTIYAATAPAVLASSTSTAPAAVVDFTRTFEQPIVLRGVEETLAVNVGAVTTGVSLLASVVWTEE